MRRSAYFLSASLLLAALGVANLLRRLYTTPNDQPRRLLRQLRYSRAAGTTGSPSDGCNLLTHTELAGSVVKWGATNRVDNASACCASCLVHNQPPQPRGRRNCTSWVWNHDASSAQFRECWLKAHPDPWSDMSLLRGVAKSWHSGIVGMSMPTTGSFTTRSCRGRLGADSRQQQQQHPPPLHTHPRSSAHAEERSLCPPVTASEASFALKTPLGAVRLRLNREGSPRAAAWIDELLDAGVCTGAANRSRCAPYCCQLYRGEAAIGINRLNASMLRRYHLDPERPPHWGRDFFWGPPYGFLQGRLWNAPSAPKGPKLPTEAQQAVLHRGTVEMVGEGPDVLIALGDHPLMPPHNAFAHVVEDDMPLLDALVEGNDVRIEPWWPNSSIFVSPIGFELRRVVGGVVV